MFRVDTLFKAKIYPEGRKLTKMVKNVRLHDEYSVTMWPENNAPWENTSQNRRKIFRKGTGDLSVSSQGVGL